MPDRTPSSWYTAISGCVRCGRESTAFGLLRGMREREVPLSGFALASLVTACERWGKDEAHACGAAIHALTHKAGLMVNVYIGTALLHLYGSQKCAVDAQRLFWEMPERNVVSWTALMVSLSSNGYLEEALGAYRRMRKEGVTCNANSFATVVSLCGSLKNEVAGLQVFSQVLVSGLQRQVSVANSLITMLGNIARVQDAEKLFYQMVERDTISWNTMLVDAEVLFWSMGRRDLISWNTMISSYVQNGNNMDALKTVGPEALMDGRMVHAMILQLSLQSNLLVCASLASLEEGMQLHGLGVKCGLDIDSHVVNAAMDMYGKCGKMDEMLKMLPDPAVRPQQCWNTLISGYARYGYFKEAEDTFKHMVSMGRKPDYVTFVTLLSACSHAGLVDKCIDYYNSMSSVFGVSPGINHCVCIVDVLGRLGRFTEAEKFIEDMPVLPNDLIWRSLLSSSRTHKNLDIGRKAAKKLLELDPFDDSAYVLLSNLYATSARWSDVDRLRSHMKNINLNKRPACSWLKQKKEVSTFGIGDRSHKHTEQIYAKLDEMFLKLRDVGYVADTSSALHDTDEEQKEQNLWNHS
ncbi:hypothetical protein ACQ4PT_055867 [Festuca glaucescens]